MPRGLGSSPPSRRSTPCRLSPRADKGDDLIVALTATVVLHAWSRWLRGFEGSSTRFLLDRFLRRGGCLHPDGEQLRVELEPASLDLVLEMSGYFAPLETPGSSRILFVRRDEQSTS